MSFTLNAEGKSLLARKVHDASMFVKRPDQDVTDSSQAWERLFELGDEIRRRTGVTRDDVKAIIANVRACKS